MNKRQFNVWWWYCGTGKRHMEDTPLLRGLPHPLPHRSLSSSMSSGTRLFPQISQASPTLPHHALTCHTPCLAHLPATPASMALCPHLWEWRGQGQVEMEPRMGFPPSDRGRQDGATVGQAGRGRADWQWLEALLSPLRRQEVGGTDQEHPVHACTWFGLTLGPYLTPFPFPLYIISSLIHMPSLPIHPSIHIPPSSPLSPVHVPFSGRTGYADAAGGPYRHFAYLLIEPQCFMRRGWAWQPPTQATYFDDSGIALLNRALL